MIKHVVHTSIAVGAVAVTLAAAIAGAPAFLHAHHPSKLIISRATTYIASPLSKDGLPDYKLALKQYLMKGVTPENNAAVPAIEIAMQGFHEMGDGPRVHYRKMGADQLKLLGVTPPRNKIPRIDFIGQFFKEHPPQGYKLPKTKTVFEGGPAYFAMKQLEVGYALDSPWRSSQCFLLSTAMQQNKAATELLRKASLLPRFYSPMVRHSKRFKGPVAWYMPTDYILTTGGLCLACHATLELGRGHPDKCWNDVMAVTRLAELAYQGSDGISGSAADRLLRISLYVDRTLLGQIRGHPQRLARVWKVIHALRLPPPLRQRYIHTSRLQALAVLLSCYQHPQAPPLQPLVQTLSKKTLPMDIIEHPPLGIDWNWQFSNLNRTFDRLRVLARAPVYSNAGLRLRATEDVWHRASHYIDVLGGWNPGAARDIPTALKHRLAKKLSLNIRYHNMVLLATNYIVSGEAPGTYGVIRYLTLVKIAYALEMYRSAHGHYPATLAALSPAFFKHPPMDPFTGRAPVYIRANNGYALALSQENLHSGWVPPNFGPSRIIMPPPPPRKWQKGPFP